MELSKMSFFRVCFLALVIRFFLVFFCTYLLLLSSTNACIFFFFCQMDC